MLPVIEFGDIARIHVPPVGSPPALVRRARCRPSIQWRKISCPVQVFWPLLGEQRITQVPSERLSLRDKPPRLGKHPGQMTTLTENACHFRATTTGRQRSSTGASGGLPSLVRTVASTTAQIVRRRHLALTRQMPGVRVPPRPPHSAGFNHEGAPSRVESKRASRSATAYCVGPPVARPMCGRKAWAV